MANKIDRRVKKTKAAILNAFEELLVEMDYSDITVTAIARRADVDRKTFYTHYRSIEDLLEEVAQKNVDAILVNLDIDSFFTNVEENTSKLFQNTTVHLQSNIVLRQHTVSSFDIKTIIEFWLKALKTRLKENVETTNFLENSSISEKQLDYYLEYYLGGFISIYSAWLQSDQSVPLEDISKIAALCTSKGLSALVPKKEASS